MDKNKKDERITYIIKFVKEARGRYLQKFPTIDNIYPYDLEENYHIGHKMPCVWKQHIHFNTSKMIKSLEAYGDFTHEWVQDLLTFRPQDSNNKASLFHFFHHGHERAICVKLLG